MIVPSDFVKPLVARWHATYIMNPYDPWCLTMLIDCPKPLPTVDRPPAGATGRLTGTWWSHGEIFIKSKDFFCVAQSDFNAYMLLIYYMYIVVTICIFRYNYVQTYLIINKCVCMYGMVWYGMVWYGMVWYGMVWYGMVWYGMYVYIYIYD